MTNVVVDGVEVGGLYRHFKGKDYIVIRICQENPTGLPWG